MKNKTVILILSVLAVLIYTTAVINFCLGNVLGGIADVLMARRTSPRVARTKVAARVTAILQVGEATLRADAN